MILVNSISYLYISIHLPGDTNSAGKRPNMAKDEEEDMEKGKEEEAEEKEKEEEDKCKEKEEKEKEGKTRSGNMGGKKEIENINAATEIKDTRTFAEAGLLCSPMFYDLNRVASVLIM